MRNSSRRGPPCPQRRRIDLSKPTINQKSVLQKRGVTIDSLLRPGGVLVAVCLNGPRQQEKLLPFSDVREELSRGTFAYTDVPTMIIRLRA